MKRRDFLKSAASYGAIGAGGKISPALGQSRAATLLSISEDGANSLDSHTVGSNRGAFEVSWNVYDRLLTYGVKKDDEGVDHYDYANLQPELAEEWDVGPNAITFKLRADAKFHDGSPVTAKDVKWSFDRAISVGGFPRFQLSAGSLTDTEQFVAVDDRTFRIDFKQRDKLTLPVLGTPVGIILNSELARKHATGGDLWALNWTKTNTAGGGAYKVASAALGQDISFIRNDDWKSGPRPQMERVFWRVVPSASTRRALLERGDADISLDFSPRDAAEMAAGGLLKVVGTPMENSIQYIGMNVKIPPFDNPNVRRAIAYATPYDKIMQVALHGRGRSLFGSDGAVTSTEWPQPDGYRTDLDKAKSLLHEAGYPDGFETTLSFDLGSAAVNEPLCLLLQENLAQIGVRATLDKVPGSNWRAAFSKKTLPLFVNVFGGWLNYPDYFFYWVYHSQNAPFNTMSYQNPSMDEFINASRFEENPALYAQEIESGIRLAFEDVPLIPLYQPDLNVAMRKNIDGYRYWFHRQLDYRTIVKT